MSKALLEHLQKNHGLKADATEADAKTEGRKLVKAGTLTIAQYGDLCAGKAFSDPKDAETDRLLDAAEKAAQNLNPREPDSALQPIDVFGQPGAGRQPNVKRASAQYDSSKSRKCYPGGSKKANAQFGEFAGKDFCLGGEPAYDMSQMEKAWAGAWLKHKLASQTRQLHLLNDHDRDLYRECLEKAMWVGDVPDPTAPGGRVYYMTPHKLTELQIKTLLADSTSGGTAAVPYFFDVDLVTFPLLYGELFPLVDLRLLNTSNQVKGATLNNMTISAGPAEGDSPTIALQTTTSIVGALTTNIYNATGAITIGRDFLSDSPIDLQAEIIKLYQVALLQWLDKEIAVGDGTTGPLGLFSVSNPLTYTSKNSTAGPYVVGDVEGMIKTLPKQYRNKATDCVFVASDGAYFRIRGMSVNGTTDQRRIFGYDYEAYMLASHPFKVENDIAAADLAFAKMSKYRMWQRKGFDIQVSTEGRTNLLENEMLVVCRSRWGGTFVDPSALVVMTNGSVH